MVIGDYQHCPIVGIYDEPGPGLTPLFGRDLNEDSCLLDGPNDFLRNGITSAGGTSENDQAERNQ